MDDRLAHFLRLAQDEAGIEDHYWDVRGNRHQTTPEAAASLLAGLGYDVSSAGALERSLVDRHAAQDARLLPETIVASVAEQPLRLPIRNVTRYELRLFLEDGGEIKWTDNSLVPRELPLGYHRLEIRSGAHLEIAHLIVCPDRAHLPPAGHKYAGLGIFLPGLRDASTWGCGDFRALTKLCSWAARELGAAYVALNPLQAIHNRIPYNSSPYLPNSLLYRNFIYLDIESLPDFAECEPAQRLVASDRVKSEIARLNATELVEYEAVARLKRGMLRLAFRSFWRRHWQSGSTSVRTDGFKTYIQRQGKPLELYALHCALDEHFHHLDYHVWNWPQWPAPYQNPNSAECAAFADAHPRLVLFHQWVQWQIDEQIAAVQQRAKAAGMAIGLFHDLPLATDRFGSELWGHREFYVARGGVGAPPDAIAPHGQDWGFPPPNREVHRASGYQHFARTIRASARHGGALRIDHVMRLFHLYCIPEGKTAMDGVYVQDYAEDLLRVLALESVRNNLVIIGEDLGTVTDGVRESLAQYGVLSYRLLYFERETESQFKMPEVYPAQALVSTTTHDLPTIAGYWQNRDIYLRREANLISSDEGLNEELRQRAISKQGILDALHAAGLLPDSYGRDVAEFPELTGELHNAIIGFVASTPSIMLTVNQEDLTKDLEQQNLPGTVHQHPNWRRKMRLSLEELMSASGYSQMLRHWLEKTGRV